MGSNSYIGVDIGGTNIVSGLMVNGFISKMYRVDTLAGQSKEVILNQIFKAIEGVATDGVRAIGLGCPGFINAKEGVILNINNIPNLQGVNLVEKVTEKFNKPTYIDNDANCFVLGEAYFGAGKNFNHILGITLGTGLGSGIVIDRKPYGGFCGAAGEIGCIPFKDGIIEDFTSSNFFTRKYGSTGYDFFKAAEKGDKNAIEAFKELGRNIGWLINNMLYTIAPEAIIIGGAIVGAYKYIEPGIIEELNNFLFEFLRKNITIKPAILENAGVIGAASLCIADSEIQQQTSQTTSA